MHRTEFGMPAVAVYNLFMNKVDKFDQMQSTSPAFRCEKRAAMIIFDFLLNASLQNVCALMRTFRTNGP